MAGGVDQRVRRVHGGEALGDQFAALVRVHGGGGALGGDAEIAEPHAAVGRAKG